MVSHPGRGGHHAGHRERALRLPGGSRTGERLPLAHDFPTLKKPTSHIKVAFPLGDQRGKWANAQWRTVVYCEAPHLWNPSSGGGGKVTVDGLICKGNRFGEGVH